jgi:putative NADH-flavin reductase
MNVLIIGATGRTGSLLVEQGLAVGFTITAFARHTDKITIQHDRLRVLQGDATDAAAIESAVIGQHAVIDVIGARNLDQPTGLFSKNTGNLIAAMTQHNVPRYVMLSGLGAGDSRKDMGVVSRLLFRVMLSTLYEDKTRAENLLMRSDREWVIVRPPEVTDKPKRGHYRVLLQPPYGYEIARGDLVHFLLLQVNDITYVHKTPIVCW